jgi:asparagine synthase (glutamine-hydrolysing)
MCGICGVIHFNNKPVQEPILRAMMLKMKHRGPDDNGVFIEDNVGLGFVRLSIIDLSAGGHQPMISQNDRYIMVYNGEIFNYIELKEELQKEGITFKTQTDSEVLLNAYIYWGEEFQHRLNGMWAFAIFDKQEKRIFASRDRYGIKPFYYIQTSSFIAFASEIPPLLILLDKKPIPDYQSIFDFLAFNRTDQTERTFFENIKKLQHGHCFELSTKPSSFVPISTVRWYNLRERVGSTQGFNSSDEFRELFTSALGLRLRSDVPVGVCLSGGLDSSSIVSVLLKNFDKKDLNTFSAVYNKGQRGYETEFILEYKPLLNNMFFTTPDEITLEHDLMKFIEAHGEPIPSTSPYAQFKVMELAKDHVVVTLDGQGADEELAGYHYFFGFFFKDLLKQAKFGKLISESVHYFGNHKNLYGLKSFLFFMLSSNMRTQASLNEKHYINKDFANRFKDSNSVTENIYGSATLNDALLDHFEYKLEHLLKWEDSNSMWFSLEARVPFLDYRIVEKVLATPSDLIIKKGMTKHLLRESMKNILPEKIRTRIDKVGFETPQNEWFSSSAWKKIIEGILDSESFKERKLIDSQKAKDLYKRFLAGKISVSNEIWKWIHLELWFRKYID